MRIAPRPILPAHPRSGHAPAPAAAPARKNTVGAKPAGRTPPGPTRTTGVKYGPLSGGMVLPNRSLTPGVVLTTDVKKISQPGYSGTVRNIPQAEKDAVAKAYGYTGPSSGVEYDHLIPLELGGSNDPKNLWPQPIAEAHVKDKFENWLRSQVVAGKIPIGTAQSRIASDWHQYWIDCGKP